MIRLDQNRYLVVHEQSEICQYFFDINRLLAFFLGKRTGSYTVHVIKGDKAKIVLVNNDLNEFRKTLQDAMAAL